MSTPKDLGNRLHALMDALAERTASAPEKEIVDDATAVGVDIKVEAAEVRGVLLAGLQRTKRERLERARAEREKILASLQTSIATLPATAAERRALLGRVIQRKPQMREAIMTIQHRNYESLSDDDVESVLKQLEHLGVLDDDTQKVTATFKVPAAVLDELGILEPSDINIENIAQYCGATIVYEAIDGCEARILGIGDRAVITVNSSAMRERQRFSAAHELGHWMRDRGKIAFACTDQVLVKEWGDDNPERRANRYAADLLLPRKMFELQARTMPAILASARTLAKTFETSMTSTAIRLVEVGSYPSMMICSEPSGRKWFARSPLVPSELWPTTKPGTGSIAARLLAGRSHAGGPEEVDADEWIEHPRSCDYTVMEDSIQVTPELVLTMLWWKNEQQILDLEDDDDE